MAGWCPHSSSAYLSSALVASKLGPPISAALSAHTGAALPSAACEPLRGRLVITVAYPGPIERPDTWLLLTDITYGPGAHRWPSPAFRSDVSRAQDYEMQVPQVSSTSMSHGWWWLAAADPAFRWIVCGSCLQNIAKSDRKHSWDTMKTKLCTAAQSTDSSGADNGAARSEWPQAGSLCDRCYRECPKPALWHKLSALNWCADGGSGRILRESETQVDAQQVQRRGRAAGTASSGHDIELAHRKQLKTQAEAAISSGSSAALLLASSCPSPASKRTRHIKHLYCMCIGHYCHNNSMFVH